MGLYWSDGTVTGSVNVEEDEAIQKLIKATGKRKLAGVTWPVETVAELQAQLDGTADDGDDEPEPPKAAKASESKSSKADAAAESQKTAEAMSQVDLPAALGKATKKGS